MSLRQQQSWLTNFDVELVFMHNSWMCNIRNFACIYFAIFVTLIYFLFLRCANVRMARDKKRQRVRQKPVEDFMECIRCLVFDKME